MCYAEDAASIVEREDDMQRLLFIFVMSTEKYNMTAEDFEPNQKKYSKY